jgi:aminocarboxymuconate-semialdehyde decarboxylase
MIDLHTHILPPPERWPDVREMSGYPGWVSLRKSGACTATMVIDGKSFREIDSRCWDPQTRIIDMDTLMARDATQVLSTVPVMFSYWAKPEHAAWLAAHLNDHIAEVCREHPGRFHGLGTVPMQDPDQACRELERCVTQLGLRGVQIGSHVERPSSQDGKDWNLSERALLPVFQTAERLGACIFVHPWDMMGTSQMPQYWLPWLVGMPAETCRAICSVLMSGLLERCPRLRIGFAHGGGSFPGTIGRIEHGYACRPDLCACDCPPPNSPRTYLRDAATLRPARFYVDSLVHDAGALRTLLELMGPERIALGSDYPFPLGEDRPGALIRSMGLAESIRERLLEGTAREFLGL